MSALITVRPVLWFALATATCLPNAVLHSVCDELRDLDISLRSPSSLRCEGLFRVAEDKEVSDAAILTLQEYVTCSQQKGLSGRLEQSLVEYAPSSGSRTSRYAKLENDACVAKLIDDVAALFKNRDWLRYVSIAQDGGVVLGRLSVSEGTETEAGLYWHKMSWLPRKPTEKLRLHATYRECEGENSILELEAVVATNVVRIEVGRGNSEILSRHEEGYWNGINVPYDREFTTQPPAPGTPVLPKERLPKAPSK